MRPYLEPNSQLKSISLENPFWEGARRAPRQEWRVFASKHLWLPSSAPRMPLIYYQCVGVLSSVYRIGHGIGPRLAFSFFVDELAGGELNRAPQARSVNRSTIHLWRCTYHLRPQPSFRYGNATRTHSLLHIVGAIITRIQAKKRYNGLTRLCRSYARYGATSTIQSLLLSASTVLLNFAGFSS